MSLVTGEKWTEDELGAVGERVINIARAFNQREGFDRKNDTIPKRLVRDIIKSGPAEGQKIPQEAFEDMLDQYYDVLGWDHNGMIPDSILKTL
jgi:aldehyde:ferredoxin oxidoreductase